MNTSYQQRRHRFDVGYIIIFIVLKTLNLDIKVLREHNLEILQHLIHVDFQENKKILNHKLNIGSWK